MQTDSRQTAGRDCVVVLGSGYVARFLTSLRTCYANVSHTSRNPDDHLAWVPAGQRRRFDLADLDTWSNIPPGADLLWCFPAAPLEAVRNFAEAARCGHSQRRLVVLGSTSAYDIGDSGEYPPPWLDETAPLDRAKPRVQGEEFLRKECAAIILRVAGIYGPGRNPLDWLKSGRVRPSDKYVNLIHVEDLAQICLAALQHGAPGEAYNVSDGVPRTWRDIGRPLEENGKAEQQARATEERGKRINTAKLRALLTQAGLTIGHPDVFDALKDL